MSVNTGNLRTTTNGLARLAKIAEVSNALKRDGKHVSISLIFTHFAFSTKTEEEVLELYEIDPVDAQDEAAISTVDVCQVQSFDAIEEGVSVTKRAFTLSANFDIRAAVTGIRTLLLYCGDRIVDNRTDEEKAADGVQHAEVLLARDYNYHSSGLFDIFAYTKVLDSNGTYQESGVSVGASAYGRSRIRTHFNYIIDDISGISESINVDSNVYPYSSGYLSQRGFEEGLRQYEEALQTYRMDWQRFAMGQSPTYNDFEEAHAKSAPRNRFIIRFPELEYSFTGTNLETGSGAALDTYKGYTAPNFEMSGYSRKEQDRASYYEDTFMKTVMWKYVDSGTGNVVEEERYLPVHIQALYYLRTGLPMENTSRHEANVKLDHVTVYHVLRLAIHIKVDNTEVTQVGEILLDDNTKALFPQVPHIGLIYLDSSGPQGLQDPSLEFGIINEGLEIRNTISQNDKVEFLNRMFVLQAKTENPSPTEQLSITQKSVSGAQGYSGFGGIRFDYNHSDPGSHGYGGTDNIIRRLAPNFAAGNLLTSFMYGYFVYFLSNDFDIKTYNTSDELLVWQTDEYAKVIDTVSMFGDLPVFSKLYDGGIHNQYGDQTNGHVDATALTSTMSLDRTLRIVSDSHLHNCRVIVTADDWQSDAITPAVSTAYSAFVMMEGTCKTFPLITNAMLTIQLPGLASTDCIQDVHVKRVQCVGTELSITLLVNYKASSSPLYRQAEVKVRGNGGPWPYGNTNEQYVAVKDTRGKLGMLPYSSLS